jgi:hypothetical protein
MMMSVRTFVLALALCGGACSSKGPTKCPVAAPKNMSSCDSSGGEAYCTYDCAAGMGSVSYAHCSASNWSVEQSGIACPACTQTDPETCDAGVADAASE